jgi:hypothetical protein
MLRSRISTGTLVLLLAVALGLAACAEPVGYGPAGYDSYGYPYGWIDGPGYWGHGWGHWDHAHHAAWGHGFAHGHAGFAGHGGFAGHAGGGFGGHGGGGGHGR